jgi:putative transposase
MLRTFSRRTVDRRIDRLDPFFVACHRYGPDAARSMFATSGAGLPKLYPMQRIELDEWLVDVRNWFTRLGIADRLPSEVRDQLPSGRRWVCAAIDVATRCIVGIRIAEKPSATEAVRLLRQVVQNKTDLARAVGAQSDWAFYGGLGEVSADGGSAFQSTEFIAAVTDLCGNIHFPPVGIPELRATIERFFGSVTTRLMPLLSGRTFRNPEERGDYDSEARTVLDDEDLLRILVMWIVDDYHHAPHAGLRGQSPAARWKELAAERFVPEPPDAHTRRTALGVEVERTLTGQGLQVATNFYSCAELRYKFRHSRQRRFRLRIDPDDIGAVSVLIEGQWIDAPAVSGDIDGVTLDAWRVQLALINQRFRDQTTLAQSIRDESVASIRATNAQRVAQLLPGSLTTTGAQIDALEQTDFAGKSWQPRSSESLVYAQRPLGTLVTPVVAPAKPAPVKTPDNATIPNASKTRWSMEND